MSQPRIFISYSHADEVWKDRLMRHLRVLELEGDVELWDDRRIAAGDAWRPAIEQALDAADAAVLLVSADFLISEFIRGVEVPPRTFDALQRNPCRRQKRSTNAAKGPVTIDGPPPSPGWV